jgi:alpha-ketoglutarate-dependent taurine dioxygenase
MSELKQKIAGLSAEKRAMLEQMLMKKKAASAAERPIPRRATAGPCALSFCQQRLWFIDQLTPGATAYNVPNGMRVTGPLQVEALGQALEDIVRRHEVLRTRFVGEQGHPQQVVAETWDPILRVVDLRSMPAQEREADARRRLEEEARRPFDLSRGPMARVLLLQMDAEEFLLLLSTHHIAWDFISKVVFYRELAAFYSARVSGVPAQLPELPIQYADFAVWQREWLKSEAYRKEAEYWKKTLGNAARKLELPIDKKRPAVHTLRGTKYFFSLPQSVWEGAKQVSRENGTTLFMTLLAAFKFFLYAYTEQEDISVGSPIAGRNRPELEKLIGFFVNTMVLRTELGGNPTFRQMLGRVKETTLGAFGHSELAFEKLVEILNPPRDLSRMALFQVNFRVAAASMPQLELAGVRIESLDLIDTVSSKFDLALELAPNTEEPLSYFEYATDLFEEGTIARMSSDFQRVLENVLAEPDVPLKSLRAVSNITRRIRMETADREKPKMKNLKDIRRKAVDLSQMNMVTASTLKPGQNLPLVLEPAVENVDLAEWARNNRDFIETSLLKHGAVLYRGFNLKGPEDFERVATSVCSELFGEYGDLPRAGVAGKIYKSTPYPNDKMILYHNESSHLDRWPMKINFYCVKAAQEGGATPIADTREVARQMDPKILKMFADKGLMYVRNFSEGLDVSWQQFFHTSDKSVVEKACQEGGMTCEWTRNNGLRIRQVCRAVTRHPKTGETIFFNQVQLHHVYCLDAETRTSLLALFKEEDLPRHVYFGDGTSIPESVMDHVGEIYEKCAVRFPWQEGCMITLDNMLTVHARDPFVGERKIVVAMGQMISSRQLDAMTPAALTQ